MNMMTVITRKEHGYEVIVGFDRPTLDPVGTVAAMRKAFREEIEIATREYEEAKIELHAKATSPTTTLEQVEKARQLVGMSSSILLKLFHATPEKIKEFAVYFETRQGEETISDKEYSDLKQKFEGLDRTVRLSRDGNIIPWLAGKKYWIKEGGEWREETISKVGIGIPEEAVTKPTDGQFQEILIDVENRRIRKLPPQAKELEKQQQIEKALYTSAIYKSQLEIQGDEDSLGKSKAKYEELKKEIEQQYS
jgi:hypothetical protein